MTVLLIVKQRGGANHTWCNLVQMDVDVVVSVRAGLLMIKPQSVEELVLNHRLVVAAWTQRQDLTGLLVTNTGEAPSSLFKLDVGLLSLIGLEVDAGLKSIHFKGLVDAAFGIQI